MSRRSGDVRIGVSGWRYPGWRGIFYPPGLPRRRELEFASRRMNSIEINGSFYSLQRPEAYAQWYEYSPADFIFAVKGSRFITHMKKLREVEVPLANFFASGVLRLHEKLGPILWQFPGMVRFDRDRLERFFELLPKSTGEASRLAKRHDHRLKGRAYLHVERQRQKIRHAVEVRHESMIHAEALALFRRYGVALVLADTAGRWSYSESLTSDFVYIRLHGARQMYVSGYTPAQLDWWAGKINRWSTQDHDVFVYFDNDAKAHAPFDAMALRERIYARRSRNHERDGAMR